MVFKMPQSLLSVQIVSHDNVLYMCYRHAACMGCVCVCLLRERSIKQALECLIKTVCELYTVYYIALKSCHQCITLRAVPFYGLVGLCNNKILQVQEQTIVSVHTFHCNHSCVHHGRTLYLAFKLDHINCGFIIAASVEPEPVVIIASSVTAGIVLLILILVLVSSIGVWLKVRQLHTPLNIVIEEPAGARLRNLKTTIPDIVISGCVLKALRGHWDILLLLLFVLFFCYLCRDELYTAAPRYTEKCKLFSFDPE